MLHALGGGKFDTLVHQSHVISGAESLPYVKLLILLLCVKCALSNTYIALCS